MSRRWQDKLLSYWECAHQDRLHSDEESCPGEIYVSGTTGGAKDVVSVFFVLFGQHFLSANRYATDTLFYVCLDMTTTCEQTSLTRGNHQQ
jgi:hypothetical protein